MKNTQEYLRGTRHLRIGIELRPRSIRIVSLWLVDQPVVQRVRLTKPLLARVDLAGKPILLEAFDDPRVIRGTFKKGAGHSFIVQDTGVIHVSAPFSDAAQLSSVRIRLINTSKAKLASFNAADLMHVVDQSPRHVRSLGEINSEEIVTHKDWPKVARQLGMPSETARVEIFVDRQGKYRWRLVRPSGEIVATSHQGFGDRSACEADLLWVRANVPSAPVAPLDLH